MIKECKTHGKVKFTGVGRSRCSKCSLEAVQRRRKKVKLMSIEYKGNKCEKCGYDKCKEALEFHHIDPAQKDFTISGNAQCKSWKELKTELDKCVMVCANCHREIHYKPD